MEVEDVDDSFTISPTEVALAIRPTRGTTATDDDLDVFVLVEEQASENAFAVWSFFADCHRVQDSIRQVWKDCVSGETPPVVATAVTQSAVSMIRRAEQDLLSFLFSQDLETTDQSYISLITWLMMPKHLATGTVPFNARGVDVSPFDDFIYLPVARILWKYIEMASLTKRPIGQWPPPIMPLRLNYISEPEKADTPEHKKLQDDDVLLSQLLLELQLPDRMAESLKEGKANKESSDLFGPINEDIFWKTMRPVWMKGDKHVSATIVVTAQIMLDIHHACGSNLPRVHKHLQYVHKYAQESFEFSSDGRGRLSTGGINWFNKDVNIVARSHYTMQRIERPAIPVIKTLTLQLFPEGKHYDPANAPPEIKARYGGELGKVSLDGNSPPPPEVKAAIAKVMTGFIRPAPADDFSATHNPLFCGGQMLKLLLVYSEAGLALENHHRSIFVTAHLYNAARQLNMLDEPWPVMDRVIELHKKAIFADAIPTKTVDIAGRLEYRLQLWRRSGQMREDGKSSLKEPVSVQTLRLMLEENPSASSKALWQIERKAEQQEDSAMSLVGETSNALTVGHHQDTASQYIARLQRTFTSVLDDISIDYIRLTKRCTILLQRFRDMWNIETAHCQGLPIKHEAMNKGNNSSDIGLLMVVHEALVEARDVREMGIYTYAAGDGDTQFHRGSMTNEASHPDRHGTGIKTAGKVFKAFLAKDKSEYKFPLKIPDVDLLEAEASSQPLHPHIATKVRRVETASELRSVLASSTYVVVEFYTDYARTREHSAQEFYGLARKHCIDGILTFVRVNADDMREEATKYYQDMSIQTYVCFKEGKQVKVNGLQVVKGKNKNALRAAVEKLADLAQAKLPPHLRTCVPVSPEVYAPPKVGYETYYKLP